jgi:formamidopyrimidine-DNA glycosylase
MPELPEVETIRRGLQARLPGREVAGVEGRPCRVFLSPLDELQARLPGQRVVGLERRGKYLLVTLERDALLVHLGMTGQLTFWDKDQPDAPGFIRTQTGLQVTRQHAVDEHTHLVVSFSDGNRLHYRDFRKFGKIRCYRLDELERAEPLLELGPEPLGPDFDLVRFRGRIRKTSRAIKAVLLDQQVAAGVGNIYADEALFVAGLRPSWRASSLRPAEVRRLHEAIPEVLAKGVRFRGTSFRDYVDSDGTRGENQEQLWVYGRGGEPCRRCGTPIRKIVIAQRGTHYCPVCQSRGGRGEA